MTALIEFMASTAGRILRAVIGLILLVIAIPTGGAGEWVLLVLGVFFLAVGLFDVCVLAPLFGRPFTGKRIRAHSA